jgi:GTP-binding protein Era
MSTDFRSGFVTIIGRPNVGKSTLMNRFIGEKIAIVSSKPQTTRNKIQGVLTRPGYQIVFIDTPGLHKPKNKLGEYMIKVVRNALEEVEAVLFVVDGKSGIGYGDEMIIKSLGDLQTPVIAVLNKVDAMSGEDVLGSIDRLKKLWNFEAIVPTSALHGEGIDDLENLLLDHLPPGPKYFPDDMITDQPERFIIAELIREKALDFLRDEVPHGVGIEILGIHKREDKDLLDVEAVIYCERDSHKGIIIGKRGAMLKQIGQQARLDMERLLGSPVFLNLWVKVREDWRNKQAILRTLGYDD